ncbi:MAG: hypothetical protein JW763_10265 [candidate division Zixibacteria bacterium]|nr:hypothetical protein [candidate division Zixibacteria bacterium]
MTCRLTAWAYIGMVVLLIVLALACNSRTYDPAATYSAKQLQDDFRQLQDAILKYHPLYFTDMSELRETLARQSDSIHDGMDVLDFARVLGPVTSSVRCGHTRLSFQDNVREYFMNDGHYLPFDISARGDSLFVMKNFTDDTMIACGARIVRIDGELAANIITRVKNNLYTDGDGDGFKYYCLNQNFNGLYMIFIDDPEIFVIDYRNPDSDTISSITVGAKSRREINQFAKAHDLRDPQHPLIEQALHLDSGYAVLTVRFFDYSDDQDQVADLLDSLFSEIDKNKINSLILDLRGNDGGDPYGAAYLARHLIDKPFQYFADNSAPFYADLKRELDPIAPVFGGKLLVLIDGGCFSTTGHLLSILKYHRRGVFIGEESGGSYACNGGYKDMTLANSGINVLLPRTVFRTAVSGFARGKGIAPDFPVTPTIDDSVDDRDVIMQTAITLIVNSP